MRAHRGWGMVCVASWQQQRSPGSGLSRRMCLACAASCSDSLFRTVQLLTGATARQALQRRQWGALRAVLQASEAHIASSAGRDRESTETLHPGP